MGGVSLRYRARNTPRSSSTRARRPRSTEAAMKHDVLPPNPTTAHTGFCSQNMSTMPPSRLIHARIAVVPVHVVSDSMACSDSVTSCHVRRRTTVPSGTTVGAAFVVVSTVEYQSRGTWRGRTAAPHVGNSRARHRHSHAGQAPKPRRAVAHACALHGRPRCCAVGACIATWQRCRATRGAIRTLTPLSCAAATAPDPPTRSPTV